MMCISQTALSEGNAVSGWCDSLKPERKDVFDSLRLGRLGMARIGFDYAMLGYNKLRKEGLLTNDNIITIIDFSLTSDKKRMFIIDLKNYKLLFLTYVAHGKNSGQDFALYFSNQPESFKSSIGFYITKETYSGIHGYSLKLHGYEKDYNDNAEERAIVIHSADYVSELLIKQQGYIGRSLGCPALAPSIYKSIINRIKKYTPAGVRVGLTFRIKSAIYDPYAYNKDFLHRVSLKSR
ncbi:MAG: murein L,D-transpeptidase catalytic domain family protein [Sphingobacteriales bacterium]|nr:murein L,D-transpeptidase catalytic domain family protein [Sphingobacteriales bacterium]